MVISIVVLAACASGKLSRTSPTIRVTGKVWEHKPYCGGAHPSKEKVQGFDLALTQQKFYIKRGTSNHDTIAVVDSIVTDNFGQFIVNLDAGTYSLIFPNKQQTFDDFYASETQVKKNYQFAAKECFEAWWQRPDAFLHITPETQVVEVSISSTCRTGFNPCAYFTGPKRP